ncbi:MAG: hypothetical protein V3W07_06360 [Syntrophobacteria bacterium]
MSGKKNKKTETCWSEAEIPSEAKRQRGTLKPQSLRPAKPLNSDPRKAGFSILNKSGGSWVEYQPNDGYISRLLLKQTRAQSKAVK